MTFADRVVNIAGMILNYAPIGGQYRRNNLWKLLVSMPGMNGQHGENGWSRCVGIYKEMSTGIKVAVQGWNVKLKQVTDIERDYKLHNKRLRKIETDLERLVDLVQATDQLATPAKVLAAYKTPVRGTKIREEKEQNMSFSEAIDQTVLKYLEYHHQYEKAHLDGKIPPPPLERRLSEEKKAITQLIEKLAKEGKAMFDDKTWEKTLVLAINEHLLNFMEISFAGHRSPNTLEKMWGRKKRYIEFLEYRYETSDVPLHKLQYKFMDELLKFNMVQFGIIENSAMKYVQILKGIYASNVMIFLRFRHHVDLIK